MGQCYFCKQKESVYITQVSQYVEMCTTEKISSIINADVLACPECGLGFLQYSFTDKELENRYINHFYVSPFENIGVTQFTTNSYKYVLENEPKNNKILEVGCSSGYFLYLMQKNGFTDVAGIEPSKYAQEGIKNGVNIINDFFDKKYFKEKYDTVMSFFVFEHLPDPVSIFKDLIDIIKDDGKIILAVPNFYHFQLQHLWYFSWPFWEKVAKKYSLKIINVQEYDNMTILLYFVKNSNSLQEIKCPYTIEQVFNNSKNRLDNVEKIVTKKLNELKKFENKTVYWWGTGQLSVEYLDKLRKFINVNIIPVDNQANRGGYQILDIKNPVIHSSELKDKHIDCLVIASTFVKEILETIKHYNITYDDLYCIADNH